MAESAVVRGYFISGRRNTEEWLCDVTDGSLPWAAGRGAAECGPTSGGVAPGGLATPFPEQLRKT